MVLKAQNFINSNYNNGATIGIKALPENGLTSWGVMYALTRLLQYELGIRTLSDGFWSNYSFHTAIKILSY